MVVIKHVITLSLLSKLNQNHIDHLTHHQHQVGDKDRAELGKELVIVEVYQLRHLHTRVRKENYL